MSVHYLPPRALRAPAVRAQCDWVTWWEQAAQAQLRFAGALWRDSLRQWWGV